MFNLLRRTRQRKAQKNKIYDVSDEEEVTTTTASPRSAESERRSSNDKESRCLFSITTECEKVREPEENGMRLPSYRRAVIEELEDFASDEELESVNLAKTAAAATVSTASTNSWRSDNLYINNIGKGNGATTRRTTTVVDEQHKDRNAGSQNEAASASAKANNAVGGQLIGSRISNSNNKTTIIDGNAKQIQEQQQQQEDQHLIAGTVIDAATTISERETLTNAVIYRQSKKSKQSNNEQKRLSRLSLSNFGFQLVTSDSATVDETVCKKRNTLQKSREFLSDIFMARGRNHQRQQRNQQQQQQQQQHQQPATPVSKSKTVSDDVIAIEQALAAHLETNSDPASVSTNSYQMTMSNNSTQNRNNAAPLQNEDRKEYEQQRNEEHEEPEPYRRERSRSKSNSAGARGAQEQPQLPNESQQQLTHNEQRAASGDFIQAANVELITAADDQQGDAILRRSSSRNSINNNNNNNNNTSDIIINSNSMGQTSGKPNDYSNTHSASSSRASTPREFRESSIGEAPVAPPRHQKQQQQPELPKITVVDCSFDQSPSESPEVIAASEEIFYDFETSHNEKLHIEELKEAHVETLEDDVFTTDIPSNIYQQANGIPRPWTRLTNVKLENVQEVAEEEDDTAEAEPDPEDDELDEALELDCDDRATPNGSRQSASSERSALKSDSNLSSSYADSGIGLGTTTASIDRQPPQPPPRSSSTSSATLPLRTPFVRDGNSTSTDYDCEEMLLQCDELDDEHFSERLVCIESISLPDVVVESTTATTTTAATTNANCNSNSNNHSSADSNDGQLNINITNGAGGNSLGNVHFIPIHIEGGAGSAASARSRSNSPKYRSLDDSCIGRNMPPSVEIVEDCSVLNTSSTYAAQDSNHRETQEIKKELKLQKARFSLQLEDAHKNVQNLENQVSNMQVKIQNLEQELSLKQWNVERLQGELVAAQKDDEYVRKKLKLVEDEKIRLRHKYSDDEDEFRRKYNLLEVQYNELTDKYKCTQSLANSLQGQLIGAQLEVKQFRDEVNQIRDDLEDQIRILRNALENSEAERRICEDKWQKEFEMLRTHNREREDTLMSDCEWQMRQMQRQCKDKLDKSNYERKQASAKAEELELELQSRRKEAETLRICQAQVKSLSGVVSEQERSIQTLIERIDNLKGELDMANASLETQIEAVIKIKYQCDNAIYDKERQMIYRIDEVRNEAAAFWENKLYTEMTRLTNELESVYVDERRDALDKLQAEHIEELRALTNRYTANEEELRAEIDELTENLEHKKEDFLTLRERSDNALLQTRMHLDRADREYQNAMSREEDRRVELEDKLKKEFELEKEEMEESFRERLSQVKDEFAKELQISTQDMKEIHRKELETQKAKLQAEKDEALQELLERHRAKMAAAEERINDVELRHQRNLKDLKAAYDAEKAALDKRDISNANEIEQLHRKCRCLTNLFEEMRMRYERRDPRQEDLREISELRTRCDSQERDLFVLTDRLREMQIQMSELQQNGDGGQRGGNKALKKPPPKTIATSCDVIYEENEERESPEQEQNGEQDDDEEDEDDDEQEPSDTESNHTIEVNGKCSDRINEDDAHMISAV